jgi:hypothetical protein
MSLYDLLHQKENNHAILQKNTELLEWYSKTDFFSFVSKEPGMVIAGGFAVQLWLNKLHSMDTDIDLFLMNTVALNRLLEFIRPRVNAIQQCKNVFQFQWPEFPFTVQVICFSNFMSTHDILSSFDFSYCKCMVHEGKLYASYDAEMSLRTRTCVSYHKKVRACRIAKAKRYCDTILNVDDSNTVCSHDPPNYQESNMAFQFGVYYDNQRNHTYLPSKNAVVCTSVHSPLPVIPYLLQYVPTEIRVQFTLKVQNRWGPTCYSIWDERIHRVYSFFHSQKDIIEKIVHRRKDSHVVERIRRMIHVYPLPLNITREEEGYHREHFGYIKLDKKYDLQDDTEYEFYFVYSRYPKPSVFCKVK